ncbi:MAG: hypothetical protein JXM70_06395 [Pirellulales bacterium]|nr:hypothetical protein [Pirellulales bacterium]
MNLVDAPRYTAKWKEKEQLLLVEMRRHDDPYRFYGQPVDGLVPRKKTGDPTKSERNLKSRANDKNTLGRVESTCDMVAF